MKPTGHIGDEIRKHLYKQKRSVMWLVEEIDCDQSNLTKKLNKPLIHTKLLYDISKALNVDLFSYYSQQLTEE